MSTSNGSDLIQVHNDGYFNVLITFLVKSIMNKKNIYICMYEEQLT